MPAVLEGIYYIYRDSELELELLPKTSEPYQKCPKSSEDEGKLRAMLRPILPLRTGDAERAPVVKWAD